MTDGPGAGPEQARYTQRIDFHQAAREKAQYGREFYVAGKRIDGSVIQHCPGTEAMVVDFENDKALNFLYEQIIQGFKGRQPDQSAQSLPEFAQQFIENRIAYNRDISDSLVAGNLDQLIATPGWVERLDPRINRGVLAILPKHGKLADEKIEVGVYSSLRAGVCRQMGVILGACMERAISKVELPGYKRVEIRANMDIPGGHLWIVMQDNQGREIVYDPAQHYHGEQDRGQWNYKKGYENHVFGVPNS